jgi:SAM-dependent methyltransferase
MHSSDEVIQEVWNYMLGRCVLTAASLDIFTQLEVKHSSAQELAGLLGCDLRALTRILDCLTAFEYLEKIHGVYSLTDKGAVLSTYHELSVRPMILHLDHIWDSWSHLTETVRYGKNPSLISVTEQSEQTCQAFIEAMHVVAQKLAWDIASFYNTLPFSRLLDIGGASGTYSVAFLHKNQNLRATLFDLPQVIPMAQKRFAREGLHDRAKCLAGDFTKDAFPTDCDLALVSAIIHQNNLWENKALFDKIHQALVPGGAVLIRDHIMEPERTSPQAGTLFALNMLVNTPGGDTYTFDEVKDLLEQAGFGNVRLIRKGEQMDCLVEGWKADDGNKRSIL